MLRAIGEFFDSLFHILWEILKFITIVFFFVIIAVGTLFKWTLILLYMMFIFPFVWVFRKIYWFIRDARAGRRKRRARREAEIYGED